MINSGYYIANLPSNSKAIIDAAQIGAHYQPGHAHADTLSFELSLFGKRFIVNSGISEYGCGSNRLYQRGTLAHNTVSISDNNSSEIWHGFRVARRAKPFISNISEQDDNITICAAHDGYMRLQSTNIHQRTWQFSQSSLTIKDVITGKNVSAKARFYFHPDVKITRINDYFLCYLQDNPKIMIHVLGADDFFVENTFWYPGFGIVQANLCLVVCFKKQELQTYISWQKYL